MNPIENKIKPIHSATKLIDNKTRPSGFVVIPVE